MYFVEKNPAICIFCKYHRNFKFDRKPRHERHSKAMGTDCTGCVKSIYHMITTTTAIHLVYIQFQFLSNSSSHLIQKSFELIPKLGVHPCLLTFEKSSHLTSPNLAWMSLRAFPVVWWPCPPTDIIRTLVGVITTKELVYQHLSTNWTEIWTSTASYIVWHIMCKQPLWQQWSLL
jgi:hypothetical protein